MEKESEIGKDRENGVGFSPFRLNLGAGCSPSASQPPAPLSWPALHVDQASGLSLAVLAKGGGDRKSEAGARLSLCSAPQVQPQSRPPLWLVPEPHPPCGSPNPVQGSVKCAADPQVLWGPG